MISSLISIMKFVWRWLIISLIIALNSTHIIITQKVKKNQSSEFSNEDFSIEYNSLGAEHIFCIL